jgi:adenylate cyclase
MPFVFSGGQINAFSLSTRRPGGFSTTDLGYVYEVLPLLSRVFEVHAMRLNAVNLLDVYLGKQSGAKVLDGLFKRGDGEDVHAVIWFSDLRNSTRLADRCRAASSSACSTNSSTAPRAPCSSTAARCCAS